MPRRSTPVPALPVSVLGLPLDVRSVPAPPARELDPFLDALVRCIERYGVARTSVPDIAREAGVSTATVYRRLGTVDAALRLLMARELDRILAELPALAGSTLGPESVINVVTGIVEHAAASAAWQKVLHDEPELIGPYLVEGLADIVDRVSHVAAPWLDAAMHEGLIADCEPNALAEAIVRLTVSLVMAPPKTPVRKTVEPVLALLLEPR